jgi:hypothetical protein
MRARVRPRRGWRAPGRAAIAVLGAAVTACAAPVAGPSPGVPLVYRPLGRDHFEFVFRTSVETPEWSPRAEADRRTLIDWYVKDNKVCPSGYVVDHRAAVLVYPPLQEYDVFYRGRCR